MASRFVEYKSADGVRYKACGRRAHQSAHIQDSHRGAEDTRPACQSARQDQMRGGQGMNKSKVIYGHEYRYGRKQTWRERFWAWAERFFS